MMKMRKMMMVKNWMKRMMTMKILEGMRGKEKVVEEEESRKGCKMKTNLKITVEMTKIMGIVLDKIDKLRNNSS